MSPSRAVACFTLPRTRSVLLESINPSQLCFGHSRGKKISIEGYCNEPVLRSQRMLGGITTGRRNKRPEQLLGRCIGLPAIEKGSRMNPLSTPDGYWDIERRLLLFLIPCSYGYSTLSASKSSARFLPLDRVCEAGSGSGSGTCSFSAPPDASRERFV